MRANLQWAPRCELFGACGWEKGNFRQEKQQEKGRVGWVGTEKNGFTSGAREVQDAGVPGKWLKEVADEAGRALGQAEHRRPWSRGCGEGHSPPL